MLSRVIAFFETQCSVWAIKRRSYSNTFRQAEMCEPFSSTKYYICERCFFILRVHRNDASMQCAVKDRRDFGGPLDQLSGDVGPGGFGSVSGTHRLRHAAANAAAAAADFQPPYFPPPYSLPPPPPPPPHQQTMDFASGVHHHHHHLGGGAGAAADPYSVHLNHAAAAAAAAASTHQLQFNADRHHLLGAAEPLGGSLQRGFCNYGAADGTGRRTALDWYAIQGGGGSAGPLGHQTHVGNGTDSMFGLTSTIVGDALEEDGPQVSQIRCSVSLSSSMKMFKFTTLFKYWRIYEKQHTILCVMVAADDNEMMIV